MDGAAAAAAEEGGLVFSNATKALAMRWYRLAKDVLEEKFKAKSESLTKEMQKTLEQMPEEEDWYYGASTRMEGRDLLAKGEDLEVILSYSYPYRIPVAIFSPHSAIPYSLFLTNCS